MSVGDAEVPVPSRKPGRLLVVADDYGYAPGYNRGILRAARHGALSAIGAMVLRAWCDPGPLREVGVRIGLHLELRAGCEEPDLGRQLEAFGRLFGRPPERLDGHRHCHAAEAALAPVAAAAGDLGIPVRAVDGPHARRLAELGARTTADILFGRVDPSEPLRAPDPAEHPGRLIEWMVHPGEPDPLSGSAYDGARAEDLALLLELREAGVLEPA